MNKNLFKVFVFTDIFIILICIVSNNYVWLINIQIAFISSLLVSLATYYSYKIRIDKNVSVELEKQSEDLDYIDKIDDPYDLYSSDVEQSIVNESPSKEEIQDAMKAIKQNHLTNLKNSILSFVSLYRILAYIFLIIGFFYLNNNNILHIYSYLLGFLIVPMTSLLSKRHS